MRAGMPISGVDEDFIQFTLANWPLDRFLTVEQLQKDFDEKLKTWQNSSCREAFLDIIDRNRPVEGWHFDKVVCIGAGTFLMMHPRTLGSSMLQFACVVDTASELEKRGHAGSSGIQVFAQDPTYFEQDAGLISSKGVVVLKTDPHKLTQDGMRAAKDHLGPHTLLFEWRVEVGEQMCRDLCEPVIGMHIGTDSGWMREHVQADVDDELFVPDPEKLFADVSDTLDNFDQKHDSCAFPPFEEQDHAFARSMVYWRKVRLSDPKD